MYRKSLVPSEKARHGMILQVMLEEWKYAGVNCAR